MGSPVLSAARRQLLVWAVVRRPEDSTASPISCSPGAHVHPRPGSSNELFTHSGLLFDAAGEADRFPEAGCLLKIWVNQSKISGEHAR